MISGVSASDKRHFTFVEDAARATVLAIENPAKQPQIFNIAGDLDSYSSFEEFHHIIKRNHNSAGSVTFTGKGQSRGKVNIAKARSILGYEPRYSLDKGIKEKQSVDS